MWPTDGREPWIPALQCCPLDWPCTPPCRHARHQGHITLSDRGSALDPWLWIVWATQHRNLYLQNQTKLYNQPLSTTSKHLSILLLFWWKCGSQEILWNHLNLRIARFFLTGLCVHNFMNEQKLSFKICCGCKFLDEIRYQRIHEFQWFHSKSDVPLLETGALLDLCRGGGTTILSGSL